MDPKTEKKIQHKSLLLKQPCECFDCSYFIMNLNTSTLCTLPENDLTIVVLNAYMQHLIKCYLQRKKKEYFKATVN